MSTILEDLKYTITHEWIRKVNEYEVEVGISDYAQESLGDITYVELPQENTELEAGEVFGVVESVKAASDLYMPIAGEIVAINENLDNSPELVNSDPYKTGWMLRIKVSDWGLYEELLDSQGYETSIGS